MGASIKEERYSNKAVKMLLEHGHQPVPVHPSGQPVHGLETLTSLDQIEGSVDTLTVYVGPDISGQAFDDIISLGPRRVVFNPGAENDSLAVKLREAGMETVNACTLVMLRTDQF
jgi:predicted CoA-binding protein